MDNINLAAILSNDLNQDIDSQSNAVSRQRKIADLLLAQGMQQPQGQMVSGRYVKPAWTQQIAPLASTAMAFVASDRADRQQSEITKAQKLRTAMQVQKFAELEQQDPALAIQYAVSTDNKFLQDMVKDMLKGDKLGEGDVLTRKTLSGKEITLTGGEKETPDMINKRAALGLPKDRSKWTEEQKIAFKNYVSPKEQFDRAIDIARLQQTNAELIDKGIGGVPIPNMNQFNPQQLSGALRGETPQIVNQPPQGQPGMVQPGMAPQNMAPPMGGADMTGLPPAEVRKIRAAEVAKQREYFMNQFGNDERTALGTLKIIGDMIGDAQVDEKGKVFVPKVKTAEGKEVRGRQPAKGFGNFVGAGIPYLEKISGTSEADYKAMYDQVTSRAFLEAFERIKGGGAITEKEGTKATEALIRAKASQSEAEFIRAMREFEQAIKDGLEGARKKAGMYRPEGGAPATQGASTRQGTVTVTSPANRTLSIQDQQALNWANQNPNDPRAAAIKQKLGQ